VFAIPKYFPRVLTPVTAHIKHCSACREDFRKIISLGLSPDQYASAGRWLTDDTETEKLSEPILAKLQEIRDRPQSGTETCLSYPADAEEEPDIKVRQAAPAAGQVKVASLSLWSRRGLAAAAVFAAAVIILWQIPLVKAVNISDLYQAIAQVLNVSITTAGSEGEISQQIWISNELNIHLYRQTDEIVLLDLKKGMRSVRKDSANTALLALSPQEKLELPWGLLPFPSLTDLPAGYQWKKNEPLSDKQGPDVAVYDLTWTERKPGAPEIGRKWRGYLEITTKLPVQIELWEKLPGQEEELVLTKQVTYPATTEIIKVLRQAGFNFHLESQM
jgi:hypothetical protein